MSIIWYNSDAGSWQSTELRSHCLLTPTGIEPLDGLAEAALALADRRDAALLYKKPAAAVANATAVPTGTTNTAAWVLVAQRAGVSINGTSLDTGIRVLSNRDAIAFAGRPPVYFSNESVARIEAFPDAEDVYCPRCKLEITRGQDAVRCASCGVWHHELVAEGRTCWTYAQTCTLCDQRTDLESATFNWSPEEL